MEALLRTLGLGLVCWRITSLLVREEGPWDIFSKFRSLMGVRYDERSIPRGTNVISKALVCMWCSSVWVGGALAFLFGGRHKVHEKAGLGLILSTITIFFDEVMLRLDR